MYKKKTKKICPFALHSTIITGINEWKKKLNYFPSSFVYLLKENQNEYPVVKTVA